MTSLTPTRIAMLGATHAHAARKARWLRDLPQIEFAGAYEPSPLARAACDRQPEFAGVPWIESIDAVLGDTSIAGVVTDGHELENPSYARRALAAGKHVLMEKPCGWTKGHADELIGLARARSLVFQMGYNYRPMPHIARVLDMAAAGAFGHIYTARFHMGSSQFRDEYTRLPDGRAYFRGGFMFNLGCHALDLLIAVMGRPARVRPFMRSDVYREASYADNIVVVLEYERGIATLEVSCLEVEGAIPKSFEIYGSEAQAIVSPVSPTGGVVPAVRIHADGPKAGIDGWKRYEAGDFEIQRPDIEDFEACIRGERQPRFGYDHDLTVHHVLMDICGESDFAEVAS